MAAVQLCSLVGAVAHIEEEGKLQGGLVAAKDFARDQVRRYVLCARVQRTCQWFAVPPRRPLSRSCRRCVKRSRSCWRSSGCFWTLGMHQQLKSAVAAHRDTVSGVLLCARMHVPFHKLQFIARPCNCDGVRELVATCGTHMHIRAWHIT